MAYTVGEYGVGSLEQLASLVVVFWLAVALFVLVVLGAVMRVFTGLSILRFLSYFREELTIVLATASSDAVLPQIMRKLERMGVDPSVVGLVVPTGYSFNLDAFSIYLTLAAVFIAQATNTPLSFSDLLLILAISLVTSKGAHGVPGSAIVILAATLNAVPAIPAIGLVLVLSIDWFIGMARALGNLIGNCVATVVVAAWEETSTSPSRGKFSPGKSPSTSLRTRRPPSRPPRETLSAKGSLTRYCIRRFALHCRQALPAPPASRWEAAKSKPRSVASRRPTIMRRPGTRTRLKPVGQPGDHAYPMIPGCPREAHA